jgi:hypothetical protein
MKFFAILLLAGAALAQQSPAPLPPSSPSGSGPTPPLPIKTGEWKMSAIVHGKDGDATHTFFTCIQQNDLARLIPQGDQLPKNLTCAENERQFTAQGMTLDVTCRSPGATVNTHYDLARNTDSLVTGIMHLDLEIAGSHAKTDTNIVFEWQKTECTAPEPAKPQAAPTPPTLASPDK